MVEGGEEEGEGGEAPLFPVTSSDQPTIEQKEDVPIDNECVIIIIIVRRLIIIIVG